MSQTTNNNVSEEFIESLKGHFGLGILENLGRDKKDLQKMWPHASSWDIQDNVPLQFGKLPYPGKVSLELSIYWDVCPYLLDYVQSLVKLPAFLDKPDLRMLPAFLNELDLRNVAGLLRQTKLRNVAELLGQTKFENVASLLRRIRLEKYKLPDFLNELDLRMLLAFLDELDLGILPDSLDKLNLKCCSFPYSS
ncbi:hypothetical protein RclHR1_08050004 [Rhizophagus clarus]|uniref:Uncharacterized protein n=1 Tax=Rhizophagus clarus TaxID=94130 RepID=A0A2Z6RZ52_9GLOM|nr:hypothetical protein RclHR1_08050004 [Rhizophagus clarus]